MAIITRPKTDASHWYDKDGNPCHTQLTKEGEQRPTTIRDARAKNLIRSVTNVLGILAKDALTTWKVNQAVLATIKHGPADGESEETYCKRIASISQEQVYEAAELGKQIHAAIEAWVKDGTKPDANVAAYVNPICDWIMSKEIKVVASEKILVNLQYGFAGTADLLFKYGIEGCGVIDFKTRKSEAGKKMQTWDTEPMQLAAYAGTAFGLDKLDDCLIANILISTTEPGRFEVIKHDNPRKHFDAFIHTCKMWEYLKKYEWRAEFT